jgi:hypothetical protein
MMSLLDRFAILFETDSSEAASEVDGLNKKLGETEREANKATKGLDSASSSSESLSVNFAQAAKTAAGLLASFIALDAIKSNIIQTAQLDDALGKLTTTMGFNIQNMDAWGAAAVINGGSADAFQATVVGLQDQLSDIQFGGGQQIIQDLSRMGVSAFNSSGKIKDTFDLLKDVSGVFEGMSAQQSASFGKRLGLDQGTILLLQQGRAGVQKLVEQQDRLGGVTMESYLAAADFNDAQFNLNRTLTSVWQTINTAILPVLTSMMNSITDVISWLRENKDFTVGFFVAFGTAITAIALPAIKALVVAVAGMVAPFAAPVAAVLGLAAVFALLFEDVKAYIEGNSSLIGDLAKKYEWFGNIVDGLIAGFKLFWEDLNSLFDWTLLFATNPSEAINVAVNKLKQEFGDLWSFIVGLFDFSFISDTLSGVLEPIKSMLNFGVGDKLSDASGWFKSLVGFGDDDSINQTVAATERAMSVMNVYAGNPLNSTSNSYGGAMVQNQNQFMFNNTITAKGANPEQIKSELTEEWARQLAAAGNMLDDGVSY